MPSNRTTTLLLILCLSAPGAALAQPGEADTAGQAPNDAVADDTQPEVDAQAEVDNGEQAAPGPGEGAATGRTPHVYQPSEDISEDLSVSFPVDI